MADKLAVILHYEVMLSHRIIQNGWNISCLLPEYKRIDYRKAHDDINPTSRNGDPCYAGAYFGRTLEPYEVVFIKTNRDIVDFRLLERMEASQIANAGIAASAYEFSDFDRITSKIDSAWKGHRNFAVWLSKRLKPNIVVDLGVDYGFSTYCFAATGIGHVYGIDSFEGDAQAGMRDTHSLVIGNLERLKLKNVTLLKGYFGAVARSWDRPIDILHIDGLHTYEAVKNDYEAWRPFVSESGVILFHDTCVPNFGVRRLFNEINVSKTNLSNSCGLGVVATNPELIAEISSVFSVLVEPGTTKL